ncbi:ABC transporter G family protein, partial [Reticulomyxa filosa]
FYLNALSFFFFYILLKSGKLSNNAADYLLETEYLSTTKKFREHWQSYQSIKMPNLEELIMAEVGKCQVNKKVLLEQSMWLWYKQHCRDLWSVKEMMQDWRAFVGLLWRSGRYYFRRWKVVLGNFLINILGGVVLGLIYGKLGTDQEDVQNRFGSLGFLTMFIGIQSIASSGIFIEQREIFIDERNARLYGPIPFLAARSLPDMILMRILPSMVFGGILFSMLGYQHHTLPAFLGVIALLSSVTALFVFAISCICAESFTSGAVSIFANLLFMLYSGIFIQNQTQMPWIVAWPKYLSFYNQAFEILFVNEMHGLVFTITNADVTVNGVNINTSGLEVHLTGDYFISFFGFKQSNRNRDVGLLVTWLVLYFAIGVLALQFLHRSKR